MREEKRKYGLFMSIAMVIGIVIGSGIFFKADDILTMTNGNVAIGCLVLIIGAFGIIFGGITIAEWAKITDDAGGIISYGEKAFGKRFAFLIGWFQMIVYYPALTAVICWVAANYTLMLFSNIKFLQGRVWEVTVFYLVVLYSINTFSSKLAGYLQTSAMVVKMIPLILIGLLGVLFGDPTCIVDLPVTGAGIVAGSSAIVAAAFSYDGWTIAPTICHEIKNAKRNLPLALTIAPVIILVIYLLYFVGITSLIGVDEILRLQDSAFQEGASLLFGRKGAHILLAGVVISVLGTCNGIILGSCRVPHALAVRGELPWSEKIADVNEKFDISFLSHGISFVISALWLLIHYMMQEVERFSRFHFDISEMPIAIMYIFYFLLYIGVMIRAKKGLIKSKWYGYVFPILAIVGACIVIYGGMMSGNRNINLIVSILVLLSGALVYRKQSE